VLTTTGAVVSLLVTDDDELYRIRVPSFETSMLETSDCGKGKKFKLTCIGRLATIPLLLLSNNDNKHKQPATNNNMIGSSRKKNTKFGLLS
jgi:hypothetical protein